MIYLSRFQTSIQNYGFSNDLLSARKRRNRQEGETPSRPEEGGEKAYKKTIDLEHLGAPEGPGNFWASPDPPSRVVYYSLLRVKERARAGPEQPRVD